MDILDLLVVVLVAALLLLRLTAEMVIRMRNIMHITTQLKLHRQLIIITTLEGMMFFEDKK